MGLINSRLHRGDKRSKEDDDDFDTPVMGDGYCPIYDAALVGDWKRLVAVCESAVVSETESESRNGNGCVNENNKQQQPKQLIDKETREKILSNDTTDTHENDTITEQESHSRDDTIANQEDQDDDSIHLGEEQQQQQQQTFTLFVDAKGNTPLHLACRRDPPLYAVRALLNLHVPSAWMTTHDGWIPLHLACHCGCDVEVANELLNAMEDSIDTKKIYNYNNNSQQTDDGTNKDGRQINNNENGEERVNKEWNEVDPLLPRDVKGRTPLHLACASSRDPRRRPDLIRLLLLRSRDPKRAALARDWVDFDQRVGLDLALGDLKVLRHLNSDEDDGSANSSVTDSKGVNNNGVGMRSNGSSMTSILEKQLSAITTIVGRTPLNVIEDDYREELEEALLPGFSIANAIKACKGDDVDNSSINAEHLDAMYECWAMLSLLLLAAGTQGTRERVEEALGGVTDGSNNNSNSNTVQQSTDEKNNECALLGSFSKPCHDVVQDFQAIHQACQSLDACPAQFKELSKKFLQGQVDKRSLASVSALKSQWASQKW